MPEYEREPGAEQDRRAFLNLFGKAAIVAPPVVTLLLSTSMSSPAIAASTGGSGGGSGGTGGVGGVGGDGGGGAPPQVNTKYIDKHNIHDPKPPSFHHLKGTDGHGSNR